MRYLILNLSVKESNHKDNGLCPVHRTVKGYNMDNKEIRLFDGQWVNIVNHDNCFHDYTIEDAVNIAVKMTEKAMARNFEENKWPKPRP